MNLFLIFLLVILIFLLIILFFFYLHKDQELLSLEARYKELSSLENQESEKNRLRDDFLAMMVHDLRSPLAVIRGTSDLLLNDGKKLSASQQDTLLSQIKNSASDMLAVVNDLLDVSKIESGRFEIVKKVSDINATLLQETEYFTALAKEKSIDVSTNLSREIPDIPFDDERIRHVMNNLLSNAMKFTPEGGKVVVSSRLIDDSLVEVCVADTGRGIPNNMKARLFNKFVQVSKDDDANGKGTGLGLVIAKGIVEAHGGDIWIEDNVPQGTKFLFTLPLR